ncbi:hypothetical protein V3C99_010329 [Haemonchus contortus]
MKPNTRRGSAEMGRGSAEMGRASAEVGRGSAEVGRGSAEKGRGSAEVGRASAEMGRGSAEVGRASAEKGRGSAEQGRGSAEKGRGSAEKGPSNKPQKKKTSKLKKSKEGKRSSAHKKRTKRRKKYRDTLYKLTHPLIDVEATIESDYGEEGKLKELEKTKPEELSAEPIKGKLKAPSKRIELQPPRPRRKTRGIRGIEITEDGLKPIIWQTHSLRERKVRATPRPLVKKRAYSENWRAKIQRERKEGKEDGRKPSQISSQERENEKKATIQTEKPPSFNASLVPNTAQDNANPEEDEGSTKMFFEEIKKCDDPRRVWMERTLTKGLNYQLRKFKDNRQYKAPHATTQASDANPHKDRYIDIRCLDATRVVLRDHPSDYINANYIVSLTGRMFICTQAPMEITKEDFWKMIVQERCRTIVMICSESDENMNKCISYYPSRLGEKVTVGKTTVTSISQTISGNVGYTTSIFEVEHSQTRFTLCHIHCTTWPDHSAPKECGSVIAIHRLLWKNGTCSPIVVHCSAGIGRTCTLVGIELLLERILLRRNPSAIAIVRLMRRCRMGAVQVSVQFIFMQLVLMELFCEDGIMDPHDPRMNDFRKKYERLLTRYNEGLAKRQKASPSKGSTLSEEATTEAKD